MGVGGIISFTLGGVMLFNTDIDAFKVGLPLLVFIALVTAGLLIITINIALKMRRQPVTTGAERLVGLTGQALTDISRKGQVRIGGEIWKATSQATINKGSTVKVTAVNGLVLTVESA